jgi:hypothetical protein
MQAEDSMRLHVGPYVCLAGMRHFKYNCSTIDAQGLSQTSDFVHSQHTRSAAAAAAAAEGGRAEPNNHANNTDLYSRTLTYTA